MFNLNLKQWIIYILKLILVSPFMLILFITTRILKDRPMEKMPKWYNLMCNLGENFVEPK